MEYVPRIEELEGEYRRLHGKISELEDTVTDANVKVDQAERNKLRLTLELEDSSFELEKMKNDLGSMEKKERKADKAVHEWKNKYEQEIGKNEGMIRENQKLSMDGVKLKSSFMKIEDELEAVKRQMRGIQAENQGLTDQLAGGGNHTQVILTYLIYSSYEHLLNLNTIWRWLTWIIDGTEEIKIRTKLYLTEECIKFNISQLRSKLDAKIEQLRSSLEEMEEALRAEETKTSQLTLELGQLKRELETRIADNEEETTEDRKNLIRQIDSLSQQLECETKAKSDLIKARKMAETEVAVLQDGLDAADMNISTLKGNLAKQKTQLNELKMALEDSNMSRENLNQLLRKTEGKLASATSQKTEIEALLEKSDKHLKSINNERDELQSRFATLESSVSLKSEQVNDVRSVASNQFIRYSFIVFFILIL